MLRTLGWNGHYKLVNAETGKAVFPGDEIVNFRGEYAVLKGGTAPHKPSSQGKVYTMDGFGEKYASVYGLKWQQEEVE